MKWLDRVSWLPLIVAAVLLGLAPFQPQPHLWEKLSLLANGDLRRPVDIFDLLLHGGLPLLVLLKLIRLAMNRNPAT